METKTRRAMSRRVFRLGLTIGQPAEPVQPTNREKDFPHFPAKENAVPY